MSTYEAVQSVLQLAPWILVPARMFAVRRWRAPLRYVTVIALGWIGLFASVMAYWNFSIGRPTDRLGSRTIGDE